MESLNEQSISDTWDVVTSALADSNQKVRAAAARALGPMEAEAPIPKLKALLSDRVPAVVLAAAHSLLLLGHPEEAWEIDYGVLSGERNSTDGFVTSQNTRAEEHKGPRDDAFLNVVTPALEIRTIS
jgi:hypothetical protein